MIWRKKKDEIGALNDIRVAEITIPIRENYDGPIGNELVRQLSNKCGISTHDGVTDVIEFSITPCSVFVTALTRSYEVRGEARAAITVGSYRAGCQRISEERGIEIMPAEDWEALFTHLWLEARSIVMADGDELPTPHYYN